MVLGCFWGVGKKLCRSLPRRRFASNQAGTRREITLPRLPSPSIPEETAFCRYDGVNLNSTMPCRKTGYLHRKLTRQAAPHQRDRLPNAHGRTDTPGLLKFKWISPGLPCFALRAVDKLMLCNSKTASHHSESLTRAVSHQGDAQFQPKQNCLCPRVQCSW